jgi:hypothetical protein
MVWTPAQTGSFLDAIAPDRLYALWHLFVFRGLRRSEAVWLSWVDVDLDAATATVRDGSQQDWDGPKSETGLVFTHEDGRALSPNGVSQRFDRLVARHDMPPHRLHDLRHVAATVALTAGVDIKVVSEQLGHTTTQITRDIYLSVMPQVAHAAAEAAAALVPRASTRLCTDRAHLKTFQAPETISRAASVQVRPCGAGGTRTRDRGIMSQINGVRRGDGQCRKILFPQVTAISIVGQCCGEPTFPGRFVHTLCTSVAAPSVWKQLHRAAGAPTSTINEAAGCLSRGGRHIDGRSSPPINWVAHTATAHASPRPPRVRISDAPTTGGLSLRTRHPSAGRCPSKRCGAAPPGVGVAVRPAFVAGEG